MAKKRADTSHELRRRARRDAAQRLLLQRGLAATSVDVVLSQASVAKGGFFHHFPSTRSPAVHVFTVFEGGSVLARALDEPDLLRRQVAHVRHYLGLLLGLPLACRSPAAA